jgi:hypothetical protein
MMALTTKTKRGGSRPRTRPQANNTSGLLGIWFRWAHRSNGRAAEVCCVVGERRISRGMTSRTPRQALQEAIALRTAAGLPVPTIGAAVRAFNRWLTNEAAHYRVAGHG